MKLIIAEKESVGKAIAKVLDSMNPKKGYIENSDCIVSWCMGHLIGLADADDYDPAYKKWEINALPIIPAEWHYVPRTETSYQLNTLKTLLSDSRVTEIVCATDADREGELIFRYVYNYCGCKKPFKRFWTSSLEAASVAAALAGLQEGSDRDNLYKAALCRSQADWIVGINSTRLFSKLYNSTLNIGRVQTPTLAMIVNRYHQINCFIPQIYYMLDALCGEFKAQLRVPDAKDAERILQQCDNKSAVVITSTKALKSESCPKLYSLDALQQDANRIFGYTAKQTLDYAQTLYDNEITTYPRTDSRYLTTAEEATITARIRAISGCIDIAEDCSTVLDNLHTAQVVGKVESHYAIIPTTTVTKAALSSRSPAELNIFHLVCQRLLAAVYVPYTYNEHKIVIDCEGNLFAATCKGLVQDGWKGIEARFKARIKSSDEENSEGSPAPILPELEEGQTIDHITVTKTERKTTPPKPYNDSTLLSAMKFAGNNVNLEDSDIDLDLLEPKGLGTQATRAGIIEKLVQCGFIERRKKAIYPTKQGINLITVVPESIKQATLTVEWEYWLTQIEHGELESEKFMSDISKYILGIVEGYQAAGIEVDTDMFKAEKEVIAICPRCGKNIVENKVSFYCEGYKDTVPCKFSIWKEDKFLTAKGITVTKAVAIALLSKKGYKAKKLVSAKGGTYDATIFAEVKDEKYVSYRFEFDSKPKSK